MLERLLAFADEYKEAMEPCSGYRGRRSFLALDGRERTFCAAHSACALACSVPTTAEARQAYEAVFRAMAGLPPQERQASAITHAFAAAGAQVLQLLLLHMVPDCLAPGGLATALAAGHVSLRSLV